MEYKHKEQIALLEDAIEKLRTQKSASISFTDIKEVEDPQEYKHFVKKNFNNALKGVILPQIKSYSYTDDTTEPSYNINENGIIIKVPKIKNIKTALVNIRITALLSQDILNNKCKNELQDGIIPALYEKKFIDESKGSLAFYKLVGYYPDLLNEAIELSKGDLTKENVTRIYALLVLFQNKNNNDIVNSNIANVNADELDKQGFMLKPGITDMIQRKI